MAYHALFGGKRIVVAIPHAGKFIPPSLRSRVNGGFNEQGYDVHAQDIFSRFVRHGPVLSGTPHRELIDYNRDRDSDAVLSSVGFHANPFLDRPHTLEEREALLTKYWDVYQAKLERLVDMQKGLYGKAFVLAGHTMEGVGPVHAPDAGEPRPDISIGTLSGQLAGREYIACFVSVLRDLAGDLNVWVDEPYAGGGYVSRRFGQPDEGLHSLQVEVNIDSYEDPAKRQTILSALDVAVDTLVNSFHF